MDHSKRKNIYIIVFVVTTIIAACVAVYFGIKVNEGKGDLQIANKDIEEYKSKLEQATVNKGEVTTPTTPSTDKKDCEDKVVTKSTPVGFNSEKVLNKKEGQVYMVTEGDMTIGKDGSVTMKPSQETIDIVSNFGTSKVRVDQEYKVTGLSGKVVDVFYGLTGQSTDGILELFLMEDGTVEYMPLVKSLLSGNVKSYGKLPGLKSIVKFKQGSEGYTNNGQPVGGARNVYAINANGEAYSISNILFDNKLID